MWELFKFKYQVISSRNGMWVGSSKFATILVIYDFTNANNKTVFPNIEWDIGCCIIQALREAIDDYPQKYIKLTLNKNDDNWKI